MREPKRYELLGHNGRPEIDWRYLERRGQQVMGEGRELRFLPLGDGGLIRWDDIAEEWGALQEMADAWEAGGTGRASSTAETQSRFLAAVEAVRALRKGAGGG